MFLMYSQKLHKNMKEAVKVRLAEHRAKPFISSVLKASNGFRGSTKGRRYPSTHHWNQKKLLCFAKHSQIMQLLLAETPYESSDSSPSADSFNC
ncbi:hypothetical protein NC651_031888 [Populus alba x Populus x berolinensis]|nr:hypothetical protein NC651_031888 [Populus alba x Populus x berolinensis]